MGLPAVTTTATPVLHPLRVRIFLWMVAVLPIHAVFLSAWISWKPFLLVLLVLAVWDLADGWRQRTWPWQGRVSLALLAFLLIVAVGFPSEHRERFVRLFLALVVGGLVMLVTERTLRDEGVLDRALRVVFWTGALMGVTAVIFSAIALGVFGDDAVNYLTGARGFDLPGVERMAKPAYLRSGFIAVSNWHQDPGYGAAWQVLWGVLAMFASLRGLGTRRFWLDGMVVGGLWFGVVMAFSRTGWVAFLIALLFVWWASRRLSLAGVGKRVLVALATVAGLLAVMFSIDVENVGGDLDLQFAFRLRQGWDLLADLTGLFASSEAFEDRFDESEERADVWPEYWAMFKANPIKGVGLGVGWETNSKGQEPHNLGLQLLAETGLVGAAGFLLLIGLLVGGGGGALGAAALATTFLPSLTQTVLFEPTWWFAGGLFLAGKNLVDQPARL